MDKYAWLLRVSSRGINETKIWQENMPQIIAMPSSNKPPQTLLTKRNSNKIWWNILNDLPMCPRRKAAAEFHLSTGHDCILKHLHRIHVAQAPFCTRCDIWEDTDADHICRCLALKGSS
ncbi:hypothetical protein TNCV_2850961 [Trichonephila clavipes]|nr:hypothetical protein TNCV_2850961 [Trichonephila clavipes]